MTDPSRLRLTGTLVAQHFRFRCERRLRWELLPSAAGVPEPAMPGEGAELLKRAGVAFERRRLRELERRFGADRLLVAGWSEAGSARTLRADAVYAALLAPGEARWLVQPELLVPDPGAFAARHGFDTRVVLASAKPDLVRVARGKDGTPRFGVVDIKWSRGGTLQHFAQVAFYSLVLEEVLRQIGAPGRVDARRGWLWTRGSRGPRPFQLSGYRHHVRQFLREELPRVAVGEAAAWHVGAGCAGCGYLPACLGEADRTDDLSRVVGITPLAREELRRRGIATVGALQRAGLRRHTYTGCQSLEAGGAALRARVQALSYRKVFDVEGVTHRLAAAEAVRVYLTAEHDPVSGRVFALGVRVQGEEGKSRTEVWLAPAGTPSAEAELLGRLVVVVANVVAEAGGAAEPSMQLYVFDRREAEVLRALLQRHLEDPSAGPVLAALAARLFAAGREATAPGTVLLDVIEELFALPLPYAWDLAGVSEVLQPREGAAPFRPPPGMVPRFSSQVAFEQIHRVWSGASPAAGLSAEIRRTIGEKLAALDSVLRAVRERAARRPDRPRLLMKPARLKPDNAGEDPLRDPLLERLRTFVRLEAAEQRAAVRQLHALGSEERAARFECIRGLERVEVRADGAAVFEFDPACREAKFRPGDFALLLTNDDGATLAATHGKAWLARKLMVELVEFDLSGLVPRVVLASEYGWDRLERERLVDFSRRCVLDRADADFNSGRVIATLEALDAASPSASLPLLLLRGAQPEAPLALDVAAAKERVLGGAGLALGRPVLNTEQTDAWLEAFERPVSVVWGPPGTGKTYLLAWTVLGLAGAARAAGRPLRVLVTATTHRAIANAMGRLGAEAAVLPGLLRPRLVKLVGRPSEADRELAGGPVELLPEERLPAVLSEAGTTGPVVVGATPWALWKQMRAANGGEIPLAPLFDVIVIDEASQMRLVDALIPLSSARPDARTLLYGDDQQLAPIVRGDYRADGLFGSAFSHFALAYGRRMLRESRRMNRVLVRYPRRLFYPGLVSRVPERRVTLRPAPQPGDEVLRSAFLAPDDPLVLCVYEGVRAGARNPWEAALVSRLAWLARDSMIDPATGELYTDAFFRREAFAVIAPHRAQNSAILGELAASGWPAGSLPVVDTVERMQGSERDLVVVSYGVADREYAEREAEFLLDANRFNVAITRARSKLIVVVSREVLRALPRDEAVMGASLALKGLGDLPGGVRRRLLLPAPHGTVEVDLQTWSLAFTPHPRIAAPLPALG